MAGKENDGSARVSSEDGGLNKLANEIWWLTLVDTWKPKEQHIIPPLKRAELTLSLINKMSFCKERNKIMVGLNE